MPRHLLEIDCDAPPYYIVQACWQIGVETPEDVRWLEAGHLLAHAGIPGPRGKSRRWNDLLEMGNLSGLHCSCGARLPFLTRYKFTLNDSDLVFYSFGQCGRCKTVYWLHG
jgi:hypothetical protein